MRTESEGQPAQRARVIDRAVAIPGGARRTPRRGAPVGCGIVSDRGAAVGREPIDGSRLGWGRSPTAGQEVCANGHGLRTPPSGRRETGAWAPRRRAGVRPVVELDRRFRPRRFPLVRRRRGSGAERAAGAAVVSALAPQGNTLPARGLGASRLRGGSGAERRRAGNPGCRPGGAGAATGEPAARPGPVARPTSRPARVPAAAAGVAARTGPTRVAVSARGRSARRAGPGLASASRWSGEGSSAARVDPWAVGR